MCRNERSVLTNAEFAGSKAEIGQVAVTYGDTGAAHEQTIDRSDQATEYGAGRRERGGSSVRHVVTFLASSLRLRFDLMPI